jgi:hypothetical protein
MVVTFTITRQLPVFYPPTDSSVDKLMPLMNHTDGVKKKIRNKQKIIITIAWPQLNAK